MVEIQIHSIEVKREDLSHFDTGGGHRYVSVEICVDKTLPLDRQKRIVTHEVIGAFLGSFIPIETLEEMAEAICNAQDELNEEV